jgi:hypothetical protein
MRNAGAATAAGSATMTMAGLILRKLVLLSTSVLFAIAVVPTISSAIIA